MMECFKRLSNSQFARISLFAGLVIAVGFAAGWSRPDESNDDIMPALGLKAGELVTLDQTQMGKGEMALSMDGEDYIIDYASYSNRSKKFRLLVQQDNGELVEQEAPRSNTIRGSLRGVAGSRVTGCITDEGCCARIQFPSGEKCYIEPVNRTIVNPDFAGVHVLYTEDDVIPVGGKCGCQTNLATAVRNANGAPPVAAAGPFQEAELVLDSDVEYFSIFGSVDATLRQMELIVNIINDQYESEVGIRHTVTLATVRPTSDDNPFPATDADTLLTQLQTEYSGGFPGDLCHLFTGKELDGNTIGLAFVGVVCNQSFGFGLTQDLPRLSDTTDVLAHELGHNWNQIHCDCPNNTMNAFLTGANDFNDFFTVPNLISYRNSVLFCLDQITSPNNDDLVDTIVIDDLDFTVNGSNINATTQADEPDLTITGSTVWWNVTADAGGFVVVDTIGSDYDTQLQVYESVDGGGFTDLILVASNDDIDVDADNLDSEVTFNVSAGTRYEIRVGGSRVSTSISDGGEGNYVLNGVFTEGPGLPDLPDPNPTPEDPDDPDDPGDPDDPTEPEPTPQPDPVPSPDPGPGPGPAPFLLGDLDQNGRVDFRDIAPFISLLTSGGFQEEADVNADGVLNFLDIVSFVGILANS